MTEERRECERAKENGTRKENKMKIPTKNNNK
jgi:hypothetical protein